MDYYDKILQQRKNDILNSIDELIEQGTIEKETLEVMKALVKKIKINKVSMEDFMDEQLEGD
jgi:hypothetical protein